MANGYPKVVVLKKNDFFIIFNIIKGFLNKIIFFQVTHNLTTTSKNGLETYLSPCAAPLLPTALAPIKAADTFQKIF